MVTFRNVVYSLVAAGSLLMAGVQALATDEPASVAMTADDDAGGAPQIPAAQATEPADPA